MGQIHGLMGKFGSLPTWSSQWEVVLVEDDLAMQALLLQFLVQLGYRTVRFRSVVAALQYLKHHGEKKRLVITDINLPQMDGYEFIEQLRAGGAPVISVLMSSFGNERRRQEALARGATAYLNKPFALNELRHILQELQDQHAGD